MKKRFKRMVFAMVPGWLFTMTLVVAYSACGNDDDSASGDSDSDSDSDTDTATYEDTGDADIDGETNDNGSYKKWHRIQLTWDGPEVSEEQTTFRDYRLDVTFTSPSGKEYVVPGFFAADGDAGETGATSGDKWRARFTAGEGGKWVYEVSFVTGNDIAADLTGGRSAGYFDEDSGSFGVGAQDKSGKDFRAKGKLEYVGEHYLRFADGDYFVKAGCGSPEDFFGYSDFDDPVGGTQDYSSHVGDWNDGDPTWKDGKGKGIIGVVNYLSEMNNNTHYFLTMNSHGDGNDTWPFTGSEDYDVYDVSKLDQWEIVLTHFDRKGLHMHFILTEAENNRYFEQREGAGFFAPSQKIYYREMVARFGHHMAITWNIGEENNLSLNGGFGNANSDDERKQLSSRLRALAYYNDHITAHNFTNQTGSMFTAMVNHAAFTGPSLQFDYNNQDEGIKEHYDMGSQKWVLAMDEPFGGGDTGNADDYRKRVIWANFGLGSSGVEWYHGTSDTNWSNWRDKEDHWKYNGNAVHVISTYLAKDLDKMEPNENLVSGAAYCLANPGDVYMIYARDGGSPTLDLGGESGAFDVDWFDPRNGGDLQDGNVTSVTGGARQSLGNPPSDASRDWVVLVRKQ